MIKTFASCVLLACALVAGSASPAFAQRPAPAFGRTTSTTPQTINVLFGGFVPKDIVNRDTDDVLLANADFLIFDVNGFKSATIGGEWLIPVGSMFEFGAGLSFSRKTVPSIYADYIDGDGTEVENNLRIRQVPLAFTGRWLPLGQSSPVQPYVGAGVGVILWKYEEFGEFIDFANGSQVFTDNFPSSGTTTAPIILGGVRFATDRYAVGGELRYQKAKGDLDPGFAGTKIDLGGWTYQATFGARF